MRIHCEWIDGSGTIYCSNEGQHILIYGCINGHLGEHIFCQDHLFMWEEMGLDDRAWCPQDTCSNNTIDWTIGPIGHARASWVIRHQKEWAH